MNFRNLNNGDSMIFYKPITDKNELNLIFSDKQFDDNRTYGGYIAYENEKMIGSALISIDGFYSEIIDLRAENDDLTVEGLIRAVLNFAGNRNAYIVKCKLKNYSTVLELLGFYENDGAYEGEIPELLKGACCKGK